MAVNWSHTHSIARCTLANATRMVALLAFCPSLLAQTWDIETVDAGRAGWYSSLAVNSTGFPHISYLDWSNNALKYTYRDDGGWYLEIADNSGSGAGWYCSLVLDGAGHPHISYLAVADSDLRYAYKDEEGWRIETMFPYWCGGDNHCITLALDGSERPHIVNRSEVETDLARSNRVGEHDFETEIP